MSTLPDVQAQSDTRGRAIQKVGVCDIRLPFRFKSIGDDGENASTQDTVGTWELYASLSATDRGTHMSRLMQILNDLTGAQSVESLHWMCGEVRNRLGAENAFLAVDFPWFVEKKAPVSQLPGKLDIDVRFETSCGKQNFSSITLKVPATSLCPCSKSISEFGAHNQRSELIAKIQTNDDCNISLDELFGMIENSASSELFSVIKREDEEWVTERAFKNAKFVEDIVRDLATALDEDPRIAWFHASAKNFESLHNHNAYAEIASSK